MYVLLPQEHADPRAFIPITNAAALQAPLAESASDEDPVAVPDHVPVYEHSPSVPVHELPFMLEHDLDADGTP